MTTIFETLIHFFHGSHSQEAAAGDIWTRMDDDSFSDLARQQMEEMDRQQLDEMERQAEELSHETNPYENPGMDGTVDEGYFGMDEGLGIADPEENLPDDSWMDNSGSDDSWMDNSGSDDSWMDNSGFNDFGGMF
jgi:hypothetical protein